MLKRYTAPSPCTLVTQTKVNGILHHIICSSPVPLKSSLKWHCPQIDRHGSVTQTHWSRQRQLWIPPLTHSESIKVIAPSSEPDVVLCSSIACLSCRGVLVLRHSYPFHGSITFLQTFADFIVTTRLSSKHRSKVYNGNLLSSFTGDKTRLSDSIIQV